MTRFNPKPTFRLLSEIPDTGRILFSVNNCERATLEAVLGPPRWHEEPPSVPTASDYWGLAIEGQDILLEHTPDLLGVYSRTRDAKLICSLLGIDVATIATYDRLP